MKRALPPLLCLLALAALAACAGKTPASPQRTAGEGGQWICRPTADRQGWNCTQGDELREPAQEEAPSSPGGGDRSDSSPD